MRATLLTLMIVLGTTARAAAPERSVDALHRRAQALITAWLSAQNAGDENAYLAFYDAARFRGVKRALHGTTRYGFAQWADDRTRQLKTKPTVAAEAIKVTTWLENPALEHDVIEVRFTQRWKNPRYADHGIKLLLLTLDAAGALTIVYEDLLNSEPGWTTTVATHFAKRSAPGSVRTRADAWAKLVAAAPTIETLDTVLDALPADDTEARLYARALIEQGDAACTAIEHISECGDERNEWKALEPSLAWPDPCVQRRAMLWALASPALTKSDVEALTERLVALVAVPLPDDAMPAAVWQLVDDNFKTEGDELRLRLLRALVATPDGAALAEAHVEQLSPTSRARLIAANELHLNAAAFALDPKTQRAAMLAALTDAHLGASTRAALLERAQTMSGADVKAAIITVAEADDDCGNAMAAAVYLASPAMHTREYLPIRRAHATAAQLGRDLCKSQHDEDPARQLRYWKSLLPPTGKVAITEHLDNERADHSHDQHHTTTRKRATLDDIDDHDWTSAPTCNATSCKHAKMTGALKLTFTSGSDGELYLSEMLRTRWAGCEC